MSPLFDKNSTIVGMLAKEPADGAVRRSGPGWAEVTFTNEVGNEILASVALGEKPENFCRLCLYGPHSSIESYTTRVELAHLRDLLNHVLPGAGGADPSDDAGHCTAITPGSSGRPS